MALSSYILRSNKECSSKRDWFFYFLIALFVIRLLVNIHGFDVVPFPSNNDEAIIQDQALHLHRQGVFKALSFNGQLIDQIGSHHPPLFLWIQALIFNILGFTPSSLRIPSIIYSSASVAVLLYCLHVLNVAGLARKVYTRLISCLLLFDPVYISWSRFGRHDPLANLLFCVSIALLLKSYLWQIEVSGNQYAPAEVETKAVQSLPSLTKVKVCVTLVIASIFIGLSLSAHIQAVYGYAFFLMHLLFISRIYVSVPLILLCAVIPIGLFCSLWAIAFKENIPYSIEIFNLIQQQFSGDQDWLTSLSLMYTSDSGFNAQKFMHLGGTLLLFQIFFYLLAILIAAIILFNRLQFISIAPSPKIHLINFGTGNTKSLSLDHWVGFGIIVAGIQVILIYFKYGIAASRFYCFYPSTVLITPILLEWLVSRESHAYFRRLIPIGLCSLLAVNAVLFSSYVRLVNSRLTTHNYDQVENIVSTFADSVKHGIAVPPVFWLAAHTRMPNKNIQIIENGFAMWGVLDVDSQAKLLKNQNLDMVILPTNSRLVGSLDTDSSGFTLEKNKVSVLDSKYFVFKRSS